MPSADRRPAFALCGQLVSWPFYVELATDLRNAFDVDYVRVSSIRKLGKRDAANRCSGELTAILELSFVGPARRVLVLFVSSIFPCSFRVVRSVRHQTLDEYLAAAGPESASRLRDQCVRKLKVLAPWRNMEPDRGDQAPTGAPSGESGRRQASLVR